jgi:hypothetical protein
MPRVGKEEENVAFSFYDGVVFMCEVKLNIFIASVGEAFG